MRLPVTARVGLALAVAGGLSASTVIAYMGCHQITKENMKTVKPPFSLSVSEKDSVVGVVVDIPENSAGWFGSACLSKKKGKKTVLSLPIAATIKEDESAVVRLTVPRDIADGAELSVFFKAGDHGGDIYAVVLGTFLDKPEDADAAKDAK